MNSRRTIGTTRWTLAFAALGGIVLVYRRWLHANATTVAITLLLLVLLLAAKWGLRYAVAVSIVATALYNLLFLPPFGTFTIADPQNWLALFAFLFTAIVASRLAERARQEAKDARARQRELETLFRLSRELLQTESVSDLVSLVPSAVASIAEATSCLLYLIDGDRLYQCGTRSVSHVELPHLRQLAMALSGLTDDGDELQIPVRTGVRPKGLLIIRGSRLSIGAAQAVGSLISISIERSQAVEAIAKNEAARESERLRTLIIDSITHQLRTPLTSIKGAASALLNGDVRPEESRELLTIIDEESDRLNQLVSEAVEMAQLDAQQVQMHFTPVRARKLLEDALRSCAWIEQQHEVHVDIPADIELHADADMLEKVLCNLLENAAKYSKIGEPITISAEAKHDHVMITVADRGSGIELSEQALIFDRFYRGRSQSLGTFGTGMGLAISRAIVEAHGGSISVTSQPERGSVFTLLIPRSRSSEAEQANKLQQVR